MKVAIILAAALCMLAVIATAVTAATEEPTCTLTSLVLKDARTGKGITFFDGAGNPFSTAVTEYYCSCSADTTSVTVLLGSADTAVTYDMKFASADRSIRSQEYMALNKESKLLQFTRPSKENPSFQNQIMVTPSCSTCTKVYTINCVIAPPPSGGSVIGDPQFVGLRGQNFQVHGVAGEVYNIISSTDMQMNSKFVFLNKGDCPVVNGKKQSGCFAHAGSYLGEIGIKTSNGDKLKIVSGRAAQGFAEISLNGEALKVGHQSDFVTFNTTHVITVNAGAFRLQFENSDLFINQAVHVMDWSSLQSHGLLGQTWRETTYPNSIKYIEGHVDDYVVSKKDLFGDEFLFNLFGTASGEMPAPAEVVRPVAVTTRGRKHPSKKITLKD